MRERESQRDFLIFMFSPFIRFFFLKEAYIISDEWNFMANFSSKFQRFCFFFFCKNWEKWGF
ncbi:hypothetical protein HMPREF1397_01492 [Helicobacter pylori GAM115Ai]|nr:hypothetical protein HMPREF1397_01492 [Helicobacter pylori GAM115Ai]